MRNIGVNFYGTKRRMYYDLEGVVQKLTECGVTSAELCIIFPPKRETEEDLKFKNTVDFKEVTGGIWEFQTAQERLDKVKNLGLRVISAQVMMGMTPDSGEVMKNLEKIKRFAKNNGLKYIVMNLAKNLEDTKKYISMFNQITKELAEVGITFVFHNHEVELVDEAGTTALDYIMENCPDLKLELDVGWVQFAGKSPVEYIKKYQDRLVLLHLKDIVKDAGVHNRDNCFPAVGEGVLPLKEILEAAENCGLDTDGIIIDQDNSFGDILEDIAVGVKNIKHCIALKNSWLLGLG